MVLLRSNFILFTFYSRTTQQIPALPIVFLLGNHSSGKSTFINYVTGKLEVT